MERIIFTKSDKTQGFALIKKYNIFYMVCITYVKVSRSWFYESCTLRRATMPRDKQESKMCRKMLEAYHRNVTGRPMLVEGRGVRGDKTELREIVCINPDIRRSQSLNPEKHVHDLDNILREHIKSWLFDLKR